MTITTLSYIHSMLKENYEKKRMHAKWQRELWLTAKENGAANATEQGEIYDNLRRAENEAYDALQDFLAHDFR